MLSFFFQLKSFVCCLNYLIDLWALLNHLRVFPNIFQILPSNLIPWCVEIWYAYIHILPCKKTLLSPAPAPAKLLQSCPTLWDPTDGSPPGSSVPGILQARTLEWVVIAFSNAWKWKVKVKLLSCVWLFATPWTAAYQAPPPMGFSRQEYWSGVPLPSPTIYCLNIMFTCPPIFKLSLYFYYSPSTKSTVF